MADTEEVKKLKARIAELEGHLAVCTRTRTAISRVASGLCDGLAQVLVAGNSSHSLVSREALREVARVGVRLAPATQAQLQGI